MARNSRFHRYHNESDGYNEVNANRYGMPAFSLYTSTKIFTLKHHIDITDAYENKIYEANTKVFTLHDTTDITDFRGQFVAHIEKKMFSFHERHYVTMANGLSFQLSNELFHIYKDITNIEGLGWQMRGNMFELNFEIYDQVGNVIAVIGQKMISMHDKYCIDIYRRDCEQIVVAILVTLQHMIRDRENARNNSSSYSSNNY
ncbi:MAG: LURP-one-related family protein [Eubacterium sp.]|nr:LURP-one-related family protein [Eubacterium sp.]